MLTAFATAPDGTQIAYEITGSGPPLILLHGGGQSRRTWIEAGYLERLQTRFRVIAIDQRGHGESGKPQTRADYAIDTLCADVLAVADACGIDRFTLVGYSYGANVGRYLAARSPRVTRFVLMGIGFGPGASGAFRQRIESTLAPWAPALEAESGVAEVEALNPQLQAIWREGSIRPLLAWFGAILDYPALGPADIPCPTLWLVGGANEVGALDSVNAHREGLATTQVELVVVEGLNHAQEITAIDQVLPSILSFLDRTSV